jgi:hypothetical protein
MLGLTTTRRLRAAEARLNRICLSAELERRRLERAGDRERQNLRRRLDRAVRVLAETRADLATTAGALHHVSRALIARDSA